LNYKYVSAEILDTFIGSIGLVLVAPFTAFTSSILLTGRKSLIEKNDANEIVAESIVRE
jgi:uncharacterized membrane protein